MDRVGPGATHLSTGICGVNGLKRTGGWLDNHDFAQVLDHRRSKAFPVLD
jgi:hypothetical protein